jgi:hypothetical protein
MLDRVIGPFFFLFLKTVTANICLDMLQLFVFVQIHGIEQDEGEILFQQKGVPSHFSHEVRNAVNVRYPNRWIRRAGRKQWPPRSPDL